MQTYFRNRLWMTLSFAMLLPGLVVAQQPMPGEMVYDDPTSGDNTPAPISEIFDVPAAMPNHPPIDEIPWLEIPNSDDQPSILEVDNSTTMYNAETGEMIVLPTSPASEDSFGQSLEGSYMGAYTQFMQEPMSAFGSMSVAGGLTSYPARANVKLILHWVDNNGNDIWSQCSGSMQDPGVVLAAAHCFYNRDANVNDWCTEVFIYPAWDGVGSIFNTGSSEVIQNFGWARSTFFLAGTDYINNGNFDRDVGCARISRGGSRNIGMITGWYGWAWGGSCDTSTTYYNYSYPAENCHNGRTMYYWDGPWDACFSNQFQLNTAGNCLDTVWGGMSGSAAYYISGTSRFVHAVCSNSNRSTIGRYCKLWEQWVTDMSNFENDTRGSAFDVEPLRVRANGSTTVTAGESMDDILQVLMANATDADPAAADYTLQVYLSSNNNISTSDTLLATWNYNGIDFAAMQNRTFNIPAPNIPVNTTPGIYWIGVVCSSSNDTVTTNNDTDTWDAQQITVTPPPPANDNWNNANLLLLDFDVQTSNIGATDETGEPDLDPAGSTIWYTINPEDNGNVTVDTFGSSFDTMLHVYTGSSLGSLGLVTSNDDTGGLQSEVQFVVDAGETYYIRVSGYNGAQGSIDLDGVIDIIRPTNDDFGDSSALPGFPFSINSENVSASDEASEPDLDPAGSTVWWNFQANDYGTVTIDTFGSSFDTMLHIYQGSSLANLTLVAANDDTGGLQSEVSFDVEPGEFYEVRVGGYNSAEGDIVLNGDFDIRLPFDVLVDSFSVLRGILANGGLAELDQSDNQDLSVQRSPTDLTGIIQIEMQSSPGQFPANPIELSFTLESAGFFRTPVEQKIEFFDFVAGTWEEVDLRNANRFSDATAVAQASGDLSRYISSTGFAQVRISYRTLARRQAFSANLDQAFWTGR